MKLSLIDARISSIRHAIIIGLINEFIKKELKKTRLVPSDKYSPEYIIEYAIILGTIERLKNTRIRSKVMTAFWWVLLIEFRRLSWVVSESPFDTALSGCMTTLTSDFNLRTVKQQRMSAIIVKTTS